MHADRLLDRVAHREAGVERLVGVLIDDLDLTPDRPQIARSRGCSCSVPRNRIEPAVLSTIRITVWAVVVFPQPDSPTSATISPSATVNETPSTACTVSCSRRRWIVPSTRADRVPRDEILDLEQRRRRGTGPAEGAASRCRLHRRVVEVAEGHVPRLRLEACADGPVAHGSKTESHRGWKGHPTISLSSRGGAPGIEITSSSPSRSGVAAKSMRV